MVPTPIRATNSRSFEGLLQHAIGLDALRFGIVERLHRAHRQNHARVRMVAAGLDVMADLVAGDVRHRNIREHDIGVHVFQPQHSGVAVCDGDHLMSFFAQDAFTHALCVRAVVRKQDTAHCFGVARFRVRCLGVGWSCPRFLLLDLLFLLLDGLPIGRQRLLIGGSSRRGVRRCSGTARRSPYHPLPQVCRGRWILPRIGPAVEFLRISDLLNGNIGRSRRPGGDGRDAHRHRRAQRCHRGSAGLGGQFGYRDHV